MPSPPQPTPSYDRASAAVHRQAARSFGDDAQRYDRTRPRYPGALMERIVGGCPMPNPSVLDVGCGTGIVGQVLVAARCRVLGVDVDERMAQVARSRGLEVEVAPFETWDAGGRRFDAVVAGQTWHWIDPLVGAARAGEALTTGGRLTAFWNVAQPPPEVASKFVEVTVRELDGPLAAMWSRPAMDDYGPVLDRTEEGLASVAMFGPTERWTWTWSWLYDRAAWVDQVPTFGGMSRLPPQQVAALVDGMGQAIDDLGGSFTMTYTTVAISAATG